MFWKFNTISKDKLYLTKEIYNIINNTLISVDVEWNVEEGNQYVYISNFILYRNDSTKDVGQIVTISATVTYNSKTYTRYFIIELVSPEIE